MHDRLPTVADLLHDGPPVRLRVLQSITGLSRDTILRDIAAGELSARRRGARNAHYFVQRAEAVRWLSALGFHVKQNAASIRKSGQVQPTSPVL